MHQRSPKPVRIRKAYIDGPCGQLHYRAAGQGEALLLVHQAYASSGMFLAAFPALVRAGIAPVAVDLPGCGLSDAPDDGPPGMLGYARSIIAVLDHFGLASAHLLGHHSGAAVALCVADLAPGRVQSLVLHGPPLPDAAAPAPAPSADNSLRLRADGSHLLEAWQRRQQFTPGWTSLQAMHERLLDLLLAPATTGWLQQAAAHWPMEPAFMRLLPPTLILSNSGDQMHRHAARARQLRPDLPYAELPGGTHDIVDEQPGAWAAAVAGFIGRQSHITPAASAAP